MDLGNWVGWSLPFFAVLISRLKGQPQNVALWVYLWGLDGVLLFLKWQGYHLYLAGQKLELGFTRPNSLSEYLLKEWFDEVMIFAFMALPPLWYLYDKRKMLTRSISQF